MKVYVGADHNGFQHRRSLIAYLKQRGYDVYDGGDEALDPQDDFPVFAQAIVKDVLGSDDPEARGILICGSGQGMCMAANRHRGIRAALGYDMASVRSSRNDDDSNVLCLPAHTMDEVTMRGLVEAWLSAPFAAAPRFVRRIKEMDEIGV